MEDDFQTETVLDVTTELLADLADLYPYESPLMSSADESVLIDYGFTYGSDMFTMHGRQWDGTQWSVTFNDPDLQAAATFYTTSPDGKQTRFGAMSYDDFLGRFDP